MSVNIAPPSESDKEIWQQLYREYAAFYSMPMSQETLNTVWDWITDRNKSFYALLAKNESGSGLGLMHFRAMPSPLRGAEIGFLDDLYIRAESRGEGLVDKMFAQLSSEAEDRNWSLVRWVTADDNYRGRAVYDKLSTKTRWVTYQLDIK